MADGLGYTAGAGATVATDEVPAGSGTHFQRVKLAYGTDGIATDVTEQSPLPVRLSAEQRSDLEQIIQLLEDIREGIMTLVNRGT